MTSKIKECKCGKISNKWHSIYIRVIQDTPIHNKTIFLNIKVHEFKCECCNNIIAETIPFARENMVKPILYLVNFLREVIYIFIIFR